MPRQRIPDTELERANNPMNSLTLIDRAVTAAKRAAHACENKTARRHYEFALALLNESWIAESGQNAHSAEQVIENVQSGLRLIEVLFRNHPPKSLDLSE